MKPYLREWLQGASFHAMISSFHVMIPSFHAVFGLRQRDKSAKVIDYNDQVIRVREHLLFGNPFPPWFSANPILPHDMRRRYKPDMRDASSHGQTSAKKQQGSIFTEDKGQRIGA